MICFAYGSNMDTARLRSRVGECTPLGLATLPQHALRFHKKSVDDTAKCNAYFTGDEGDYVIGVLFDVPDERKPDLDRVEGLGNGYHEQVVTVTLANGTTQNAFAYVADETHIDDSWKPTVEYRASNIAATSKGGRESTACRRTTLRGASPPFRRDKDCGYGRLTWMTFASLISI